MSDMDKQVANNESEKMKEEVSKARKDAAIDALFASTKKYEPELIRREFNEKLKLPLASEEEIATEKAKEKAKMKVEKVPILRITMKKEKEPILKTTMKVEKEPIIYIEDQLPGTPWTKKTTGGRMAFGKTVNPKPGQGNKFDQKSEGNAERVQKQVGQVIPLLSQTPASIQAQGPRVSGTMRRQQAKQMAKSMVRTTASWDLMQAAMDSQQQSAMSTRTFRQRQSSLLPLTNQVKDASGSWTSDIRYCRRPESAVRDLNEQVDGPSAGTSRNWNQPKVKKASGDEKSPLETNQKEDNPGSVTRTPELRTKQQARKVADRNEGAAGPPESTSRSSDRPVDVTSNSDNEGPSSWSSTLKALQKKIPQQAGSSDPKVLGYLPNVPNLTWAKVKKIDTGRTKKKDM